MSAARIDSNRKVWPLDGKSQPDQVVTEEDARDPAKVARLLGGLLNDVAGQKRQFTARRIDYEDQSAGGSGEAITLQHNFGGRVRWWVVDWTSGSAAAPILIKSATDTTDATLVLYSYQAGTVTIRVEAAG